jgi:hypothetical protein
MQPYTIIQTPQTQTLTLTIPQEFQGKRVSITVVEEPVQNLPDVRPNSKLLQLLHSAPTLSEDELQAFTAVREHFNTWEPV